LTLPPETAVNTEFSKKMISKNQWIIAWRPVTSTNASSTTQHL
jgi:hypothetical protein